MKLYVHWGHVSAQQLKRASLNSDGVTMHLLTCVDEVARQCEVCQASDKAPRVPVAGTSAVAMFNGKLQVDLLFLEDIIAVHVIDVFSRRPLLQPVHTKNSQVWGAFCSSRIGVFGPPTCIQTDEGGEWKNAQQTELRSDRRIKLLFRGVGARPINS